MLALNAAIKTVANSNITSKFPLCSPLHQPRIDARHLRIITSCAEIGFASVSPRGSTEL